jgi:hypothetical protein
MKISYNPKMELVARSLRISGIVSFVMLALSSNSYFENKSEATSSWDALPTPILVSLGLALVCAIAAQIWLIGINRSKRNAAI